MMHLIGLAAFKAIIYVLVVISLYYTVQIGRLGRAMTRSRRGLEFNDQFTRHRLKVNKLMLTTAATVAVVLGFAVVLPDLQNRPGIFLVHLRLFAVPFAVMLPLVAFGINGKRFRKAHRFFGWPVLGLSVGTNILGAYMALLLPW